jgi:hypothetical protein
MLFSLITPGRSDGIVCPLKRRTKRTNIPDNFLLSR